MGLPIIFRVSSHEATSEMHYVRRSLASLLVLFLISGSLGCASQETEGPAEESPEEVELASQMADLQRWTHKTVLALDARNAELADFYLHEVEETVGRIQEDVPTYEGHPVAELSQQMLVPSVDSLDNALEERAWPTVDARVQELARSCNRCHRATEHGFIKVDLGEVQNPFPQDFSTSE